MPSRVSKSNASGKTLRTQPDAVILERALGFTLVNNSACSLDSESQSVAYAAGCVVVLRSLVDDQQRFIQSNFKKSITAIEFSPDGRHIATGESGHQPMVRIWTVADGLQQVEFAGHHFRVVAVRFSPSGRYLVSLGSQEDNTLYVWDRISKQRIASAKVTNKINGLAFSPNGQFFVTVGVRHIRYWYLEVKRSRHKETIPLNGRNAVLGDLLNNNFMDVCCLSRCLSQTAHNSSTSKDGSADGSVLTLVVSRAGQLLQFNDQRYLDKWVELRTPKATCLSVYGSTVAVGCMQGTCLLFHSETLQFLARVPLPHQLGTEAPILGSVNITANMAKDNPDQSAFADVLAIRLDGKHARLVCFYADHSVYVWDIGNLSSIECLSANCYHSRGVWSIDCPSELPKKRPVSAWPNEGFGLPPWWSPSMFVTCADDGTIRIWDLCGVPSARNSESVPHGTKSQSDHSSECMKEKLVHIIYTDATCKYLCVSDRPPPTLTYSKFEVGVGLLGGPAPSSSTVELGDSALPSPTSPMSTGLNDSTLSLLNTTSNKSNGACVRTVAVCPDCRHLAAGDRDGTLRVYSLETLEQISQVAAHDGEVLSLSFFRSESVPELSLLCSASRDRLIHIFDPNQEFSLVQTVADHSAAIFAARIIETEDDGEIRLISCGMDKSLLIRVLEPDDAGLTARFSLEHHLVGRCSQLDAAFTPTLGFATENKPNLRKRYLAVACQDRRLRIYNVSTGRQVRCYRGSFNEEGCLLRCTIDPTGSIVATSGSDKQLNLFHLLTGESIATLCGHSELVVGMRFLPTLQHLVTVSSDSCVFVWRLASNLLQQLGDCHSPSGRAQSLSHIPPPAPLPTTTTTTHPRSISSLKLPRAYRSKAFGSCAEDLPTWDFSGDSPTETMALEFNDKAYNSDHSASTTLASPYPVSQSDTPETASIGNSVQSTAHPAFYFSVSALPAWARRKLSRRCSVALVPSCCPTQTTANPNRPNAELDTDVPGSGESMNSSAAPSSRASPSPMPQADIMSVSEYRPSDAGVRRMTVKDSRRMSTVSRDSSPGHTTSAPSTPFRRVRSTLEHDRPKQFPRHPTRHTAPVLPCDTPGRWGGKPRDERNVDTTSSCVLRVRKASGRPSTVVDQRTRSSPLFDPSPREKSAPSTSCVVTATQDTTVSPSSSWTNVPEMARPQPAQVSSCLVRNDTVTTKATHSQHSSSASGTQPACCSSQCFQTHSPSQESPYRVSQGIPQQAARCSSTCVSHEFSPQQTWTTSDPLTSIAINKTPSNLSADSEPRVMSHQPVSCESTSCGPVSTLTKHEARREQPLRPLDYSPSHTPLPHLPGDSSPLPSRSRWLPDCTSLSSEDATSSDLANNTLRPAVRPKDLQISTSNRMRTKSTPTGTTSKTSMSTLNEAGRLDATYKALEALQEALSVAVQRCADYKSDHGERTEELNTLSSFVSEELQWRFAKLRAILGLEPMSVDSSTARVLLTELVERLVPELRPDTCHTTCGHIHQRAVTTPGNSGDWEVARTVESARPMSGLRKHRSDLVDTALNEDGLAEEFD